MPEFSAAEHKKALLRRRIKFVVEKGSMARLFRAGTSPDLQKQLFVHLQPADITAPQSIDEYDKWLLRTVELPVWAPYARQRDNIEEVRWGYFAKLINILVYEILSNRELVHEADWSRLRPFIHLPIDVNVTYNITRIDPQFQGIWVLKGMTKHQYLRFQADARVLADSHGIPAIWLEDAWA